MRRLLGGTSRRRPLDWLGGAEPAPGWRVSGNHPVPPIVPPPPGDEPDDDDPTPLQDPPSPIPVPRPETPPPMHVEP